MSEIGTVLVTGASGYIALHTIKALLDAGHEVRGSLRTPARGETLVEILRRHGSDTTKLHFVSADLDRDEGWAEACAGCSHVLHIASPFPNAPPRHEDDLIKPAREGALRVLQAAADAGVKRVVMTSSLAAVLSGRDGRDGSHVFDEEDWTDLDADIGAYEKSKTIAERAAWTFLEQLPADRRPEFCVINPGLVLGPVLEKDAGTSVEAVLKLMRRDFPGCPPLGWALVDVRDVAAAHITALTAPDAPGHRYLCAGEHVWLQQIAEILDREFGPQGYRIPTGRLPAALLRLAALFDKTVRLVLRDLNLRHDIDNSAIRRDLHWNPRPVEQTVIDTARSLIQEGLVTAP